MPTTTPAANSPVQIMDWRSALAQGNTSAQTRSVGNDELVEKRLNKLTASNSQYIQQARDRANSQASASGMLTGSMAAGNAQRAAIDAALPIASQDATTYSRTASENMAAQNADALADQAMHGQLVGQEVGIRANLDEAERNRGWQTGEREATQGWQTGERVATQGWQTGEREATQGWQTGEREAGQVYQTGERRDTQGWQTSEREATQGWQTGENRAQWAAQAEQQQNQNSWQSSENRAQWDAQLQQQMGQNAWQEHQNELNRIHETTIRQMDQNFQGSQADKQFLQQRFQQFNDSMLSFNNQLSQTLASIYSNPNLKATEQAAAAANARATYQSLLTSYASTMSAGVPEIFWQPYSMPGVGGTAPAGSTGGVMPPVTQPAGGFGGTVNPAIPSTPYRPAGMMGRDERYSIMPEYATL